MEFDAQSQCSDEGIELPTSEYGYQFTSDSLLGECLPRDFLEAKTLYLLLPKNVLIPRAARLQWLLSRLNTTVSISNTKLLESSLDIEVIAAIPREQNISLVCSQFLITYRTEVKFIAHSYRLVYCLDMSPSHASVGGKEIVFDQILDSFKTSIEGLSKQFTVPGNSLVFQPSIHLTIMANTPFFITPAQQVILKGIQMTPRNVNEIIKCVETHFYMLENKIAEACMHAIDKIEAHRSSPSASLTVRCEISDIGRRFKIPMVTPDANFVNMLRYSMLAIHLLPEPALSHILVITDGIVSLPDSSVMETMLHQLHYDAISVSFLKVGSAFHPQCGGGLVPYIDLLYFFAHSTLGTCIESFPKVVHDPVMLFNYYQEKFLIWSFHNFNCRFSSNKVCDNFNSWTQINDRFHSQRLPNLLSKRQTEDSTNTSVLLLLARRMREGFTVENIFFMNGNLEVKLIHQWKSSIYIQYKVVSQWPVVQNSSTHFEVHVYAPYEFLHDMTCLIKKETKSVFRQAIIQRFWSRLSQISTGDLVLGSLLSNFDTNKDWYTLPDSVKSGLPVFTSNTPTFSDSTKLTPRDNTCVKFVTTWQGICQIETSHWRKWFHTHKISLILTHDTPLPSTLYIPNSSQRYQVVQCRQAVVALYGMLSNWSSFVLIDNDTYLKLLFEEGENQPPVGFCIVRVSTKFPSAVLNLGFSTDTPGQVRYEICDILKAHLASLSYLPKANEPSCCVLLHKPLEKILIRYERVPTTYTTVVFPDGTQPVDSSPYYSCPVSGSLFTTLSRYLFHKRWIWNTNHIANPRLSDTSVSRILNTLTWMRLKEGYHFAYSSSGIVTMVLELWLDSNASCVVQYVLFPPYYNWGDDFLSGSDEETEPVSEVDAELQMITEVWVEPQYGKVLPSNSRISYFDNKNYHQIAEAIYKNDLHCINVLLTMEHISLMCQNKALASGVEVGFARSSFSRRTSHRNNKSEHYQATMSENGSPWYPIITPRIEHIPFNFDPIGLLHLSQQTELLFSMLKEEQVQHFSRTSEPDAANTLLLDNIFEHFTLLHDRELKLTDEESESFTNEVFRRHANNPLHFCPISEKKFYKSYRWKCYIKGISVTHVILTFVPASVDDLKALTGWGKEENFDDETEETVSSRGSNVSDVPINTSKALCLPVYVYDCPLKLLVNAYIENENGLSCAPEDAYFDHRFKYTHYLTKEVKERLKGSDTESCSEETDTPSTTKNIRDHCNALEMTLIKCYVLSLFVALHTGIYIHNTDVQNAMDLCDEDLIEIDITDYITKICAHARRGKTSGETLTCSELRNLHSLTKKKFLRIVCGAFNQISSNVEFYYFRHPCVQKEEKVSSDDDINESEMLKICPEPIDVTNVSEVSPLFLHFVCTLKWDGRDHTNKSVRVLPTCLRELFDDLEDLEESRLQVTLDILCLTLPARVQNILSEYTQQGLRTTSFCSEGGFQRTISTTSDASVNSDLPQPLKNLTPLQKTSVDILCEQVKWLLEDEICTSLLDTFPVTGDTLSYVINHVIRGQSISSSCKMEKLTLNFVYITDQSHEKFLEEFLNMKLPSGYKLSNEGDCYYVAKDSVVSLQSHVFFRSESDDFTTNIRELFNRSSNVESSCKDDTVSQQSEISSGSVTGTDAGYDEDISEDDDEDCDWLVNISNKRAHLPNFWLILKIDQDMVYVYFHCRFLELKTNYVEEYSDIQRAVCDSIADLCKRVNQLLLLQSLYKSRTCESLLEPDDSPPNDLAASSSSYSKLKGYDPSDISDDSDTIFFSRSMSEASLHLKPGYFSCPVVWEKVFFLHPRLKTGSGSKSGVSRGILALKNILEKFSVMNRSNMFVYKDEEDNVFYLRLYESSNIANSRGGIRLTEEGGPFSRSPSIASLPIGHNKPIFTSSDQSIASIVSADHLRPRVRSFGEKESRIYDTKDSREKINEDTLILKVHGITEVGSDVQCGLIEVLQNKLDDAVLDFLSGTLARNAMCPLTPEDVRFIQKPQPPDCFIRCTVQEFALQLQNSYSFIHYLRQNLLQFLNVPKYTDSRPECQFKDYTVGSKSKTLPLDNIFVYNQSQSPTSGSRGIACIVLALITKSVESFINTETEHFFETVFISKDYDACVDSYVISGEGECPESYLEFRLWKQGRINMDNLAKKLTAAIRQATWDIVSEYYLLKKPLCVEDFLDNISTIPKKKNEIFENLDLEKEIEYNCELELAFDQNIRKTVKDTLPKKLDAQFFPSRKYSKRTSVQPISAKTSRSITYDMEKETGSDFSNIDNGVLSIVYSKFLPSWMEFGDTIKAPAVRKQVFKLNNRHLPNLIVRELIGMLPDHPKAFRAIPSNSLKSRSEDTFVPFISSAVIQRYVIISRSFQKWQNTDEDCSDIPVALNPQNLKHTQKFVPVVLDNVMIPRQKLFWISVESENIIIYTYNWAKENMDKLIKNCMNLAQWLALRSCFLNSAISQKLGLFYNQPLTRKCFMLSTNNYYSLIGSLEAMSKFPRELHKKTYQSSFNLPMMLEIFRDNFCNTRYTSSDAVVIFTIEMREMKSLEKKNRDEMKKLHIMYQSRSGSTSVSQLSLLMQNCRILHYVHTPLLFLPRWRFKSAATRDHSRFPSQVVQLADKLQDKEKESWHSELCYSFFCEYRNYLQTLGFSPLQIDNPQAGSVGLYMKDKSSYNSVFYIQRTILGGILIFTVSFEEPFFVCKLHAIECSRLQNITSRASVSGFTLSFLDECDKVKVLMHLHSFTYDYHMRTIYHYVAEKSSIIPKKYNVHQFLDDFLKYYNKSPNFARNLVHTGTITIEGLVTEGKQLFDYLLSNVSQYGFNVLEMENGSSEFILVQVSTARQVSYKDSQDRLHTDDFDMTLVVYNLCLPYKPTDKVLHLKYYLILTSKRDKTYPTLDDEQKLGKFRTVSSTGGSSVDKSLSDVDISLHKSESNEDIEVNGSFGENDDKSWRRSSEERPISKLLANVTIMQESVNYLGYYSLHEQSMLQLIMDKSKAIQQDIRDMVSKGMAHCRTNLLWNRMIAPQESTPLNFDEFMELKRLAKLIPLSQLHPNLGPLLNQPFTWYEGLAKLLLNKYQDQHRTFRSPDLVVTYHAILNPRYYGAFMLLSLDLGTSRGELFAVYREPNKKDDADPLGLGYEKSLRDGFVNCICFYIWSGMFSG